MASTRKIHFKILKFQEYLSESRSLNLFANVFVKTSSIELRITFFLASLSRLFTYGSPRKLLLIHGLPEVIISSAHPHRVSKDVLYLVKQLAFFGFIAVHCLAYLYIFLALSLLIKFTSRKPQIFTIKT